MAIREFVKGKMYRYTGGKTKAEPGWDWTEEMDFMLDGKYHLCTYAHNNYASFEGTRYFWWDDIMNDMKETDAIEGNYFNVLFDLRAPLKGTFRVQYDATPTGKKESTDSTVSDTSSQTDNVNHPSHYTSGDIECIDAIKEATKHLSGFEGFLTGNCIKYLWRWKHKNGLEDLKKTIWYCNKLIEEVEDDT